MDIHLGTKIRQLRKKKGLTQEDLAAKLNISPQAVSKWENGTCYPDMAQIPVLAGFFGVSLDALFSYDVTKLNEKIDEIIKEAGLERAHEILIRCWTKKDGSVDCFSEDSEQIPEPFRQYYSKWGLDALGPCPW